MSSFSEEQTQKEEVPATDETAALVQKRIYKEDGPYTDQQLTSALAAFSNAVGSAYSIIGLANSLKTRTSTSPVNKVTNYYLTDSEKLLLRQRARQFAEPGIVPYDVLEDFLFVLCAVDDYEILKLVSIITKVVGLDNPNYVREPTLILNVQDLNKIGYMANGLASLTKQIDSGRYPQASSASDNNTSAYSSLYNASSGITDALQTISQFPGVGIFSGVLTQAVSLNSTVSGLVSSFSSDGSVATKIASLTNVANQLTALKQTMASTTAVASQQNVGSLFPLADKMNVFLKNAQPIINAAEMMKNVTTSNSFPKKKIDDINVQLKGIFNNVTALSTNLSQLTSLVSSIASPGNVGKAAGVQLSLPNGYRTSSKITEETLGQAVPPHIIANNPMKTPASYIGRAFFGEGLIPAIDHMADLVTAIGSFPQPSAGAGVPAFKMQNFASMGGTMSIETMIAQLVYGVSSVTVGTPLASIISSQVADVASLLGVATTVAVELRRSDNAIPLMIGVSRIIANDSGCPFSSDVFAQGWKMAASVGNDLQNSRPEFLRHVQTSL